MINLFDHIKEGGKISAGDRIIVIDDITNGAGMVTARIGEKGILQSNTISGNKVRIKLKHRFYAINYAPTKSLKLDS